MTTEVTDNGLDLEAFLKQARRPEQSVVLYARVDILADIQLLKVKRNAIPQTDEDSYGGDDADAKELDSQIEDLYAQMYASRILVRVSTLSDLEIEEIESEVRKDLKDEADAAAAKARETALTNCRRADIKAVNDINTAVRSAALLAAESVFEREVGMRKIAKAIVSPIMSREQVGALTATIGEGQVNLITAAYARANNEIPVVDVPKSLKPSENHETGTSS